MEEKDEAAATRTNVESTGIAGARPGARRLAAAVIFGAVPLLLAAAGLPAETAPRPNIVLFLSDDMGWEQVGFNGGVAVPTPNIDRIANEGVKLTQFYVQPSCAPTRAALMTGRFSLKNGIRGRPPVDSNRGIPLDERTIAEALRDADYETWLIGKWHLGHWKREHLPLQRGFDHHYGHYGGLIGSFGHGRGALLDWHRNGRPVVEEGYSTFLMADEASDLIERHDGASPFFLYLAFNAVHGPHHAPDEYLAKYGKPSGGTSQKAQLECMDVAVGRVIGALEAKGILDDTVVMFLNDNGGTSDEPNGSYRGSKGSFTEGGVRVPAVVRWPAQISGGSVSDGVLHVVDLFPTFAGLAGASTDAGLPLDGLDAWDTIANGAESPRTEIVFHSQVIRMGDWKLIDQESASSPAEDLPQLFNISVDPYETTNLAATETAKVAELRARLDYHGQSIRDQPTGERMPASAVVYGEEENAAYGAAVRRALSELKAGNPGPTLVRLEAAGGRVKLVFDEALDPGSVPSKDAFTVVVNPGYNGAGVTDVEVSGTDVLLTLDWSPTLDRTVGLTYEVPDSGAIRDLDRLDAVGVTWVSAPVSAALKAEAVHGGAVVGTTLTIVDGESTSEASEQGFSLAPENGNPGGIWSDGETAWVADLADARLYAYRREDGERLADKEFSTRASPMDLWSDGETVWVAHLGGALRAHRLSDGARLEDQDLALEENTAPGGIWSDGKTVWVSEWLGDTVRAYRLSSGRREPDRDIQLAGGNLMPAGLWSDGQTLQVADWRGRVYAYRLSDGSRNSRRDIDLGAVDTDPTGLWSGDGTLLATGWESGEVRVHRLKEAVAEVQEMEPDSAPTAGADGLPIIADPALRAAVEAALGTATGEAVNQQQLADLEELAARNAGIRDLSGLERAVGLKELDLGDNPLEDLRPLAALPALESLNLDGATNNLQALASLPRLRRLSLRNNGIEDLWPLVGLTSLTELVLENNRIVDLRPLAGLRNLAVLRADRNRIEDLWPLASLAGLEALDLEANRVQDLRPLAGLARLQSLALGGNGLSELGPLLGLKELTDLDLGGNGVEDLGALSSLTGLRRLVLRDNAVGDLGPLRGLPSLVWVQVGGSRLEVPTLLDGLDPLTASGRDD